MTFLFLLLEEGIVANQWHW